jgi:hypothetical protein
MEITVTNNKILTHTTKAYKNFESGQIPFAAVKLNVRLQNANPKKINEIIEDNFRSEKDLIFKQDKNYFILMKRTTIEAAERAVNRLKGKIGHIIKNCESLNDKNHNHASAYIFGASAGTKRMHIKHIDLNLNLNDFDKKTHKVPSGYGEYLRWLQFPKTERLKINQSINIVI